MPTIKLDIEHDQCLIFAMQQNGIALIKRLAIELTDVLDARDDQPIAGTDEQLDVEGIQRRDDAPAFLSRVYRVLVRVRVYGN